LGGIELMPAKNDTYFRHLKTGERDYKQSDSGGLFMLVTATGNIRSSINSEWAAR
jgi:hypothetical protein